MAWIKNTRWCLKKGGQFCLFSLNCLLLLTAAVLILFIGFLASKKAVPAPRQLIGQWVRGALPEDLNLSWGNLTFDLHGGIYMASARVYEKSTGAAIFTADDIYLNLDLWNLLLGRDLIFDRIGLHNGNWYIQPHLSPSGTSEKLIEEIHLDFTILEPNLRIEHLEMTGAQTRLIGHGEGPIPRMQREARSWQAIQAEWSRTFLRLLEASPELEAATIHLAWRSNPVRENFIRATATAGRLEFPDPAIVAEEAFLEIPFLLLEHRQVLPGASLKVKKIRLPDQQIEIRRLSGLSTRSTETIASFSFPAVNVFRALEASYEGITVELPRVELDSPTESGRFQASARLGSLRATARGKLDGLQSRDPFEISGYFDGPFRLSDWFPRLNHRLIPEITETARFEARFLPETKTGPALVEARVAVSGLKTDATTFAHVETSISLDRDTLRFHPLYAAAGPGETASGRYHQNLEDWTFRIEADGTAFLRTLDTFFGEWWLPIGETISLESPAEASVLVTGNWTDPRSFRAAVGAVATNAFCRKLPLGELDMSLVFDGRKVHLYRLVGTAGEGSLDAEIAWFFDHSSYPGFSWWEGKSRLGPDQWPKLLPALAFDWLTLDDPPEVDFNAWFSKETGDYVRFRFRSDHPLHLKSFPFENGRATGTWQNGDLDLPEFRFGVHEGLLTGHLTYRKDAATGKGALALTASVSEALYQPTIKDLSDLLPDRKADEPGEESEDGAEAPGRLTAHAELSGTWGKVESFSGFGEFRVAGADLGNVRLLGGLSRLFEGVGAGFTTLKLSEAEGTWKLDPGLIQVPRIELTGPNLSLNARGTITVPDTQLDFKVGAFNARSLFGIVTSPIHGNLSFSLKGTLNEPSWTFALSPFQWMRKEKSL